MPGENLNNSQTMKIALIEEDKAYVDTFSGFIQRYARDRKLAVQLTTMDNGVSFISDYHPYFDIIILSVENSFMDGIALAKRLRKFDDNVILVLISETPDAAISGYRVKSYGYMLKDTDYASFAENMDFYVDQVKFRSDKTHMVCADGGVRLIRLDNIRFVEIQGHTLCFHMTGGDGTVFERGKLGDLESEFAGKGFYRINKSYLINLAYITGMKGDSVFMDDAEISISRRKKQEFKSIYAKRRA